VGVAFVFTVFRSMAREGSSIKGRVVSTDFPGRPPHHVPSYNSDRRDHIARASSGGVGGRGQSARMDETYGEATLMGNLRSFGCRGVAAQEKGWSMCGTYGSPAVWPSPAATSGVRTIVRTILRIAARRGAFCWGERVSSWGEGLPPGHESSR